MSQSAFLEALLDDFDEECGTLDVLSRKYIESRLQDILSRLPKSLAA